MRAKHSPASYVMLFAFLTLTCGGCMQFLLKVVGIRAGYFDCTMAWLCVEYMAVVIRDMIRMCSDKDGKGKG